MPLQLFPQQVVDRRGALVAGDADELDVLDRAWGTPQREAVGDSRWQSAARALQQWSGLLRCPVECVGVHLFRSNPVVVSPLSALRGRPGGQRLDVPDDLDVDEWHRNLLLIE